MVLDLVNGRCTVPEFERSFYDTYLETPEAELSDNDASFFSRVQELLDWTAEEPDIESRAWGWKNHPEYIAWVRGALHRYQAGQPIE
jgi:hypothetical protein